MNMTPQPVASLVQALLLVPLALPSVLPLIFLIVHVAFVDVAQAVAFLEHRL